LWDIQLRRPRYEEIKKQILLLMDEGHLHEEIM
jgi:hypothetical protein